MSFQKQWDRLKDELKGKKGWTEEIPEGMPNPRKTLDEQMRKKEKSNEDENQDE